MQYGYRLIDAAGIGQILRHNLALVATPGCTFDIADAMERLRGERSDNVVVLRNDAQGTRQYNGAEVPLLYSPVANEATARRWLT